MSQAKSTIHISDINHSINKRLHKLYPSEICQRVVDDIIDLVFIYEQRINSQPYKLSEKDVILITYGDQVNRTQEPTLKTLKNFLDTHLKNIINSVHILPFYPSSSDDGFSVVNYSAVDPHMGSWREIEVISSDYRLMVDAVINHISQFSNWFKAYLASDIYFKDFFIELDPTTDLSKVIRPRTSPVLSEFIDDNGKIHDIWTTFSKDQVDLNYKNPRVLRNVFDYLFYYIEKGAKLIRLDAIAFIWKEVGTTCVHLPQTHELVHLIREVLHEVAPEVIIITETNVPHSENISYFGNGDDEAQMVYNFALPPLLLYSVLKGDTEFLINWARTLELPNEKVCFFNFTASHDGIGLRPVKEILGDDNIEFLVKKTKEYGGLVSMKTEPDGSIAPYELNCSYIDALSHPLDDDILRIKKMLITQATVLVMPGVPGIYFHSLVGSRNYFEGVKHTGVNRSINREKLNIDWLENELNTEGALAKQIFDAYKRLISIRTNEKVFNPFGNFRFLDFDHRLFVMERFCLQDKEKILIIHNFSNEHITVKPSKDILLPLFDIITSHVIKQEIKIEPYQILWLKN
jgi:sucrose phosphorylase